LQWNNRHALRLGPSGPSPKHEYGCGKARCAALRRASDGQDDSTLVEAGLRREVRERGKITDTAAEALTVTLAHAGRESRFRYEVGPCGYCIGAARRMLIEAA
jgi:hypothetical protein